MGGCGFGTRLGGGGGDADGPGTPVARHPNYPRFRSGAHFNEGSPALANSQEKKAGGVRTLGRTLVAPAKPDIPDTSDQAVEDILREVRNATVEEDIDAAARERMGLGEAKR